MKVTQNKGQPPLVASRRQDEFAPPSREYLRRARSRALLSLIISVIVIMLILSRFSSGSADPFHADAIVDPPFTSLTYGIHTFLWWDDHQANIHLDWARLMVFSHVKQVFAWEDIEIERGRWDFSRADAIVAAVEARGLQLVVRLSDAPAWSHPNIHGEKDVAYVDAPPADYADFATYCGTVAGRYRGRIAAYQIWNEPNLAREWGNRPPDAAAYVELLRGCSAAIAAADPAVVRISAGLAPTGTCCEIALPDDAYLRGMYAAGFQRYVDVVGVHAPGYSAPELSPDEAEATGSLRFFSFRRVEDMRRIMIEHDDAARQMAVLEMGWTTDIGGVNPDYAWYAVDEETQAEYLVRAYAYAAQHWRPWVGLMTTIYIADPEWTEADEQFWFSITAPNGRTKPAFIALANMAKYCGETIIPARAPDSPEALGLVLVTPCN